MKFRAIAILGLILIVGCCQSGGKWCELKQKVEVDSYLKGTYKVKTYVWVRDWKGWSITLEKFIYAYGIHQADVDSVKAEQYRRAYPIYLKVKECIDSGIDPCKQKAPE